MEIFGGRTNNNNGNIGSLRPSGFTPAFGRAETPSAWGFIRRAKALRYHKSSGNDKGKSKSKSKGKGKSKSKGKSWRGEGIYSHSSR
ncbi:MAG TPA: hypothetical protein VK627_06990 [Edaphobacter sp.]|nr:hypothetical protein [Edaphobacter sp.]